MMCQSLFTIVLYKSFSYVSVVNNMIINIPCHGGQVSQNVFIMAKTNILEGMPPDSPSNFALIMHAVPRLLDLTT